MKRHIATVAVVGAGLAIALIVRQRTAGAPAKGASVLLVTIDTLRADRVGAYGSRQVKTPNLDGVAASGTLFEQAFASVPLTLPSHATILSGLEPTRHGVHDNGVYVLPPSVETLATILKPQGYATGAFVAAYVLDRRFGLARGFDVYDDRIERRADGGSLLESQRRGEAVAAAAEAWMKARTGPFLAWVHLYDPHAPYDPPSPEREQYPDRPYDAEVAYADRCLGRLLAAAEHAARRRLLVAIAGDHGEALGDHGERTHGFFVYGATLRVPLVMSGPGVPKGQRKSGPARTVDILPMLLARLGVPAPSGVAGRDLLTQPSLQEAYAETRYPESLGFAPLHSFRSGALKYIEAPTPELFDLQADPEESTNLAAVRPTDAKRLQQALAALRANEARAATAPADAETTERLRSLGYVGGAPVATNVIGVDPKDALPWWRAFEDATAAEARGDGASAILGFTELATRQPGNVVFQRGLASALRKAGRSNEALAATAALVKLAPEDALAWHENAVALAALGRLDDALKSARKAASLNATSPEPIVHLGLLEARSGRPGEALRAFRAALSLDPNNARAWADEGNALRDLGRPAEAEAAYDRARSLAPRDPDPLNGKGVIAVQAGRLDAAVELFTEALALDPGHGEARLNLAVAEASRGHAEAALAQIDTLLRTSRDQDLTRKAKALRAELQSVH